MMTTDIQIRAGCAASPSSRPGSRSVAWLVGIVLALAGTSLVAQNILEDVSFSDRPGGQVELVLTLSGPVGDPQVFSTDSPPRIALDLPDTRNGVTERQVTISSGSTSGVSMVEAAGRTRVVIELFQPSTFNTRIDGNRLIVLIDNGIRGDMASAAVATRDPTKTISSAEMSTVESIDFRRGRNGEGRVLISFSSDRAATDLKREGDRLVLDIFNASLPPELSQRLDVLDFATPVQFVETRGRGNGARMIINATGPYNQMAYQAGTEFVVEITPIREDTAGSGGREEPEYSGNRVTFNFQDIAVRSVLQLLADVSELNIVVSDSTQGNVTLRLINVPWDQALDIVLQAKGLDKRRNGNVIWIAPASEIAQREQALEDARIAMDDRAQLVSDYIAINYGNAEDIARLLTEGSLQGGGGGAAAGGSGGGRGFLSDRGSVSFDLRTNTLLLNDIAPRIAQIRELVALLDRPVQQVLIESRIVVANENFARDIGVRFGVSGAREDSRGNVVTAGGRLEATDAMSNVAITNRLLGRSSGLPVGVPGTIPSAPAPGTVQGIAVPNLIDRLGVNLPAVPGSPSFGFTVLGQDYLLDLELSALEAEGKGEVISSPRVITASQQEAVIAQGQEVPFQSVTAGAGGAAPTTQTEFKEAVLELRVTPTISPDQRVFMLLDVSQDSIGGVAPNGEIILDVRRISTGVLVDNGQTVVLGGIYETESRRDVTKVPALGDVPVLGNLFRRQNRTANKRELLIFVTPKILAESLR